MDPLGYFIDEDIGKGDATTQSLGIDGTPVKAKITVQESCVLAGGKEAVEVFKRMGASAVLHHGDGSVLEKDALVLSIDGPAGAVLKAERLALNILSRMSGIATATRALTEEVRKVNPRVSIAATRKTTPGFRIFEKKAVVFGGGDPHRMRLDDMVLIKDNHLSLFGTVKEAVERSKANTNLLVEVEVETFEQCQEAVEAGADIIMLDNMTPSEATECYNAIKECSPDTMVEVSGGITLENAVSYANCADRISMSRITSYAPPIDFTLHFHGQTTLHDGA